MINFRTGMLFLPAGTANQYLARGWFDRNSPHRARSLLRDRKLEEPPRDFPTGLGIDPRDLSAAHHFLQVNRRILHHRLSRVRSADPTLALFGYPRAAPGRTVVGLLFAPGSARG